MPISEIGSSMRHHGVSDTPVDTRAQNHSSSGLALNLSKVELSTSGFKKGHRRQKSL